MSLLLGRPIDGDDAREDARLVEVQLRTGVGTYLVVAAGIGHDAAQGHSCFHARIDQREGAVTASVHNPKLLLFQHHARRRQQLDVEHLAGCLSARNGTHHVRGKPDGLALEVGGVVEMQIDLLLRTDMIEIDDVAGILLQAGYVVGERIDQQEGRCGHAFTVNHHRVQADNFRNVFHENVVPLFGYRHGQSVADTAYGVGHRQAVDGDADRVEFQIVKEKQDVLFVLGEVDPTKGLGQRLALKGHR